MNIGTKIGLLAISLLLGGSMYAEMHNNWIDFYVDSPNSIQQVNTSNLDVSVETPFSPFKITYNADKTEVDINLPAVRNYDNSVADHYKDEVNPLLTFRTYYISGDQNWTLYNIDRPNPEQLDFSFDVSLNVTLNGVERTINFAVALDPNTDWYVSPIDNNYTYKGKGTPAVDVYQNGNPIFYYLAESDHDIKIVPGKW